MKLPCVPPRNLRHTFGTLAIAAGADISVVARQLGHSDIKTTARYYLRPDLSVLRSLQRAWERLIIGAAQLSVTQTLIKSQYGTVTGVKSGKIAQISINWKSANTDSWGSGQFGTIPEGWRPAVVTHGTWSGRDGGSQRDFILETNGNFRYVNCGAGQNSGTFSGTMTYILA